MKKNIAILAIEDEPLAMKVVQLIFASLGITCHTATTGRHALEALKKKQYDLILLDLGLPDISGIEILKIIEEQKLQPKANITILTGHSKHNLKKKSVSLDSYDFIQKPFALDKAKRLLEKYGM